MKPLLSLESYPIRVDSTSIHGGYVYALRIGDDPVLEFDKFLRNPDVNPRYAKDFGKLLAKLDSMANHRGFDPSEFRPEPNFDALPSFSCELRVFCLRWSMRTLILGNGGVKKKGVRTYQEVPVLDLAAKHLQQLTIELTDQIRRDGIFEAANGGFMDPSGGLIEYLQLPQGNYGSESFS